jgi:hypothetical protein
MRQLRSQAAQDGDDWGAWLKWTPMTFELMRWISTAIFEQGHGIAKLLVKVGKRLVGG